MHRIQRCSSGFLLFFACLFWFNLLPLQMQEAQSCDVCQMVWLIIRSRVHANLFQYDEAIADMDAAIALAPDNPVLYVERGQRIMLLYEWDRALADYNMALEFDPDYADAYYFRGVLYASVPEASEARQMALADFARYLELAPNGQHAEAATEHTAALQAQREAVT